MCLPVVLVKSGETAGDSTNEFDELLPSVEIIIFETYCFKSYLCF